MNKIIQFYDEYVSNQIKAGINDRIFKLYRRLIRLKLTSNATVLEIGCGIGCLTYLLSRKIKHGKIEATDISPKSISYARQFLSKPNLTFTASNILEYTPIHQPFDLILLFDVLEHIPIEDHRLLFSKICSWMHHDSKLLINLPNPEYIIYDKKNNPDILQEVDQPISTEHLATVLTESSLVIDYFETYGVWMKNDYQFLVVTKKSEYKEEKISNTRNLCEKSKVWIDRKWRKIVYNYPLIQSPKQ